MILHVSLCLLMLVLFCAAGLGMLISIFMQTRHGDLCAKIFAVLSIFFAWAAAGVWFI